MPELPEVETIRRGLEQTIVGLRVADVEVLELKSLPADADLIDQQVIGHQVAGLSRFAKVLVMHLDSSYSLMFHLKMTGQLVLQRADGGRYAGGHPTKSMADSLPDKSTRVIFTFDGGTRLYFNDQRKFGWIKLVPEADVARDTLVSRLGPEPLTEAFELPRFAAVLARRKGSPIKAVILDQSTVSGVGNIYADEALHLARIHPAARAGTLSRGEAKRLYEAIRTIIRLGVEHGGTSFTSYVNALGGTGDYLQHSRVFRKQGSACPVCGTVIIKTRVAGRGTHLCPSCQQAPKEAK